MGGKYLIGIDEVGRGPLAGPVTVAAVALPTAWTSQVFRTCDVPTLKDSKKLTAVQRERWFKWIKFRSKSAVQGSKLFYSSASVYPKTIDRINVSQAANLAATRALKKLLATSDWRLVNKNSRIFLDGGLFINQKSLVASGYPLVARTVIGGDEKFNCIKLASIVAKVRRDRLLRNYHKEFPQYGFEEHKGYGTKAHLAAIKKYGPCELHRLTFLGKYIKINSKHQITNSKQYINSKFKILNI